MVLVQHWVTGHEAGTGQTVQRYTLALSAVLKSHSRCCPIPERTRTAMCTSLIVNPFLPLHSLGQPSLGRLACFHPAQLDPEGQQLKELMFEQMMYCMTAWDRTGTEIQPMHKQPTPYEQHWNHVLWALLCSTVSFRKTSSKYIQLSSPVQLLHFLPSSSCWLITTWEMLSHKVLCPGLDLQSPPLLWATSGSCWGWACAGPWCFPAAQLPLAAAQCQKN